jgi:phosphoenolpyruvate---glycerone phosphotransferase subunit DhaL
MLEALERWLRLSAERIHDQADALTALDRAIGDGDHGLNLDRGFTAITAQLDGGLPDGDSDRARAGAVLRTSGRTLISTVGGAAGPLYGTAFMRAGAIVAADADQAPEQVVLAALEAGIGGIVALGKAAPGEKTMLDAIIPAHTAGVAALHRGGNIDAVILAAADAAEAGAIATIPLVATKGRASYLGERSVGHQDPGATSSALLLRALADTLTAG